MEGELIKLETVDDEGELKSDSDFDENFKPERSEQDSLMLYGSLIEENPTYALKLNSTVH